MASMVTENGYILLVGGMIGSVVLGIIGWAAGWYK